jgi:hypothetical protein
MLWDLEGGSSFQIQDKHRNGDATKKNIKNRFSFFNQSKHYIGVIETVGKNLRPSQHRFRLHSSTMQKMFLHKNA